jgi:zinc protease
MNAQFLEDIAFDKIKEVYVDRFADASDFIFVIVGNMEADSVKVLARKYIGAIPDVDRKESWIDRKVYEPEGKVEKVIPMALETPKASVNIILNQEMAYNPYHRMVLRVIDAVLTLRYDETVREEESGTYGVGLGAGLIRWPVEKARMQISFDCAPERYEELKGIIYNELDKLAEEGPAEEDLAKTKENILKDREENKQHNVYYLSTLYNYYVHGINFDDPANYEDILNSLTAEDVQKVMKEFYTDANIVDVVFIPKQESIP